MIEVKGTAKEIASLMKDVAPTYPAEILGQLDIGTWMFYRNEVRVDLTIVEDEK